MHSSVHDQLNFIQTHQNMDTTHIKAGAMPYCRQRPRRQIDADCSVINRDCARQVHWCEPQVGLCIDRESLGPHGQGSGGGEQERGDECLALRDRARCLRLNGTMQDGATGARWGAQCLSGAKAWKSSVAWAVARVSQPSPTHRPLVVPQEINSQQSVYFDTAS